MKISIELEPTLTARNAGDATNDELLRAVAFVGCNLCCGGGQHGDIRRCSRKDCHSWPWRLGAGK